MGRGFQGFKGTSGRPIKYPGWHFGFSLSQIVVFSKRIRKEKIESRNKKIRGSREGPDGEGGLGGPWGAPEASEV